MANSRKRSDHQSLFAAPHKLRSDVSQHLRRLSEQLVTIPSERRGAALRSVLAFEHEPTIDQSFDIGKLRAMFANLWEVYYQASLPVLQLREIFTTPLPINIVLELARINRTATIDDVEHAVLGFCRSVSLEIARRFDAQLFLWNDKTTEVGRMNSLPIEHVVSNLHDLAGQGFRYRTVYADPPWPYDNRASNGAAENHYPTMSVDDICNEPVGKLIEDNAHLHLWTTNAFLRDAFAVIKAWGFEYKSCFVWVKPEMGMGNYWRVSHEFMLLGVRGRLRFADRRRCSWLAANRTIHSRKPGKIRVLIEKVSPGPYLEMYGREELPDSAWTVYGNQVERRLF